jgi:hypothetical protein
VFENNGERQVWTWEWKPAENGFRYAIERQSASINEMFDERSTSRTPLRCDLRVVLISWVCPKDGRGRKRPPWADLTFVFLTLRSRCEQRQPHRKFAAGIRSIASYLHRAIVQGHVLAYERQANT